MFWVHITQRNTEEYKYNTFVRATFIAFPLLTALISILTTVYIKIKNIKQPKVAPNNIKIKKMYSYKNINIAFYGVGFVATSVTVLVDYNFNVYSGPLSIPIMLNTMLFLLIITNKDLLNFSKRKIVSVFTNNGINLGKIEPQNSLPLNRNLGKGKKEKVEDARITIEAPSSDTHGETVATNPTL